MFELVLLDSQNVVLRQICMDQFAFVEHCSHMLDHLQSKKRGEGQRRRKEKTLASHHFISFHNNNLNRYYLDITLGVLFVIETRIP